MQTEIDCYTSSHTIHVQKYQNIRKALFSSKISSSSESTSVFTNNKPSSGESKKCIEGFIIGFLLFEDCSEVEIDLKIAESPVASGNRRKEKLTIK